MKIDLKTVILSLPLFLTACLPHLYKYYELEYKGARQTRERIDGKLSAPGLTFIQFHEIRIIAMLKPGYLQIGFQVPSGQTIQLKNQVVVMNSRDINAGVTESPNLIPVSRDYLRNLEALPWDNELDPFGKEDYLGLLKGASSVKKRIFGNVRVEKTYLFIARFHNILPDTGIIQLPDMLINGQDTAGASIPFKKTTLLQGDALL